jgi:hypothetical protein
VAARDGVAIDLDVTVGAAPDDDLAAREREALSHVGARRIDEHETRFALPRPDALLKVTVLKPAAAFPPAGFPDSPTPAASDVAVQQAVVSAAVE